MTKKLEQVVAVRKRAVENGIFNPVDGFIDIQELTLDECFDQEDVMVGSRDWLEKDENFLQIIPYCLVTSASGQVLTYLRTPKGGEEGLHGKASVGVGGHVNIHDLVPKHGTEFISLSTTVHHAMLREIHEEIKLPQPSVNPRFTNRVNGLIYDPSDEVGRVHLGVIIEVKLSPELEDVKHLITSPDDGLNLLGFFPKEYLLESDEIDLESWSRIALEAVR